MLISVHYWSLWYYATTTNTEAAVLVSFLKTENLHKTRKAMQFFDTLHKHYKTCCRMSVIIYFRI